MVNQFKRDLDKMYEVAIASKDLLPGLLRKGRTDQVANILQKRVMPVFRDIRHAKQLNGDGLYADMLLASSLNLRDQCVDNTAYFEKNIPQEQRLVHAMKGFSESIDSFIKFYKKLK